MDGQTDGRTDGIAMAYTRYSIYAVARKNQISLVLIVFGRTKVLKSRSYSFFGYLHGGSGDVFH